MSRLPLEGIRIADIGQIVAIPYATQLLAWLGAEVILIESEERLGLRVLPPFLDGVSGVNRSGGFNALNNNKLSCTVNITRPEGVELAHRIIAISDVVVENYTTGTMEKFGLGYEDVRRIKPDIVYLSLTAFGRTGPMKDFSGFHSVVNLFSGVAAVTGYPGGYPRILGATIPDFLAGSYSVLAILQALHYRTRTGRGQFIDVSMVDSMLTTIPEAVVEYTLNGREAERVGNQDQAKAPHDVFRCKGQDQWIAISVATDDEWQRLCNTMGHPEWVTDPRFADGLSRWHHQDELKLLIESWTNQHDPYVAMKTLQRAGVAATPTLDSLQLLQDPHMNERGFVSHVDHPVAGRRLLGTTAWKIEGSPPLEIRPAPLLGQHNDQVLQDLLGLSSSELAHYQNTGALWQAPIEPEEK